jgi:hypothetical protein
MFEWISFKDKQPSIDDMIIGYDGSFYGVGRWTHHDHSNTNYISSEVGACCHTDFKSENIKLWSLITDADEVKDV